MSTPKPALSVSQTSSLFDEKVFIRVKNLKPNQAVTIATCLKESGQKWTAHAHYLVSEDGSVDLCKNASLGGSYKGVDPMGLFWSISMPNNMTARLVKHDVTTPLMISVSVLEDHIEPTHSDTDVPLVQANIARYYMGEHVTRVPVREGRIRGTLFVPKGSPGQQFPGIIDLYGLSGSIKKSRAALLASRGFLTLSLAYMNYEDLPKTTNAIDLEYFEEAVNWLNKHHSVLKDHLGVIGLSLGAEIAILISTITDKALLGMIGPSLGAETALCLGRLDFKAMKPKGNWFVFQDFIKNVPNLDEGFIPVEKSRSDEILFIYGVEDSLVTPKDQIKLCQRLWNHGNTKASLHMYSGAGHVIEPPYTPLCKGHFHKLINCNLYTGGEPVHHAHAQRDAWNQILKFFQRKLGTHTTKL